MLWWPSDLGALVTKWLRCFGNRLVNMHWQLERLRWCLPWQSSGQNSSMTKWSRCFDDSRGWDALAIKWSRDKCCYILGKSLQVWQMCRHNKTFIIYSIYIKNTWNSITRNFKHLEGKGLSLQKSLLDLTLSPLLIVMPLLWSWVPAMFEIPTPL